MQGRTVFEVLFEIVALQYWAQRTHCSKLTEGYLSSIPFILIGKSAMAFLTSHLHLTMYSNPGIELWGTIQGFCCWFGL